MAVGISSIQFQSTDIVADRRFESVVVGRSRLILARNASNSLERQVRIGIVAACDSKIVGPTAGGCISVNRGCRLSTEGINGDASAIGWSDDLPGSIWVQAGWNRMYLIVLIGAGEVDACAANVGQRGDCALTKVVLHVEVPLLRVGPGSLIRKRHKTQRRGASAKLAGIQIVVTGNVHNTRGLGVDIVRLEGFGIGLVAVRVFVENAVSAADRPFSIPLGIIGKTNARSWIPPVILHATLRNTGRDSAIHPSVVGISNYQS